ncbi:hypothetical protein HDG34_003199 [Paraburkholderia sp. HC6.4b]|uniref:hypothetical protein n=1 Tax=unclassified Paraburkholderia TaxID=2615204 RepID=UPI001613177A|nr:MULTISPECIES: hypothetical protein [unclassified Paraburkholderia]MBB5409258.1 hypothetical protein [Paraburkholderia sp. HC6.4b]MBB5450986.1 hypothetical protein [Paraburkholderia sp. Kb1A]
MRNKPIWSEEYRGHHIQGVHEDGKERIEVMLRDAEGPGVTIATCSSRKTAKAKISHHVRRKTPRFDEIIRTSAWRVRNVTIDVNESMPTVAIGENVFLQGEEADNFIEAAKGLYEQAQTVTMDDCYACVAHPYVESCET